MPRFSRRYRVDAKLADQLTSYWDELTETGRPSQPEPTLVHTIERLRQLDTRDAHLNSDPAFAQRLASELFGQPALSPSPAPPPVSVTAQPPRRRWRSTAFPRLIRPSRWLPALELLAVAAILLLLVSSYPGRNAFNHGTGPAATPAATSASVPMLGGNPARTGEEPGPGPSGVPIVRWKAGEPTFLGSPAVVDGVVYASTLEGPIAFEAATGTLKWQSKLVEGAYSSPAVVDGVVYVGSYTGPGTPGNAGFLIAYDATTGSKLWRASVGNPESSAPVVANGLVFIAGSAHGKATLYATDAQTGTERWHASLGEDQCQCTGFTPAVSDGVVYVGSAHGTLYAFDTTTGKEQWHVDTGGNEVSTPSVAGGAVFIAVFQNGGNENEQAVLYAAYDAKDGRIRWETSLLLPQSSISLPGPGVAAANGVVYEIGSVQTSVGVRAVDAATGNLLWMTGDPGMVSHTTPVLAGGVIYIGGADGGLSAIDASSGKLLWRTVLDGRIGAAPAVLDGTIYVGTLHGVFYALSSLTSGTATVLSPVATSPPMPTQDGVR